MLTSSGAKGKILHYRSRVECPSSLTCVTCGKLKNLKQQCVYLCCTVLFLCRKSAGYTVNTFKANMSACKQILIPSLYLQ